MFIPVCPMHVAMAMFVDQPSTPQRLFCRVFLWLFCVVAIALRRANDSLRPSCLGNISDGGHFYDLRSILPRSVTLFVLKVTNQFSGVARLKASFFTSVIAYLVYFVLPLTLVL